MNNFQANGMKEDLDANYVSDKLKLTEEINKKYLERLLSANNFEKILLHIKIKFEILVLLIKRFNINLLYFKKHK